MPEYATEEEFARALRDVNAPWDYVSDSTAMRPFWGKGINTWSVEILNGRVMLAQDGRLWHVLYCAKEGSWVSGGRVFATHRISTPADWGLEDGATVQDFFDTIKSRYPNATHATYKDSPPVTVTGYTTKDSGQRAEFSSGMVRDTNSGKPRFDLTMPLGVPYEKQMLTRFAELMARGAEKYTDRNWEQAKTQEELNRFRESAFRHFMQWYTGEADEDHAAAVWYNIQGAEYVKWRLESDDD